MFSRIVSSLSTALDFNLATLSGCIDIIAIPSEDGRLQSTPFHVRFGKTKVLRSREKEVTLTVNGRLTPVKMTLGHAGEAYFKLSAREFESVQRLDVKKSDHDDSRRTQPARLARNTESEYTQSSSPDGRGEYANPRIQLSLCGHLLDGTKEHGSHDEDVFRANILERQAFEHDPNLWYHPSLVFRFGPSPAPYLPARVAMPLIASWAAFNKSLGKEPFAHLLHSRLKYRDPNLDIKKHLQLAFEGFSPRQVGSVHNTLREPAAPTLCPGLFGNCCSPKATDLETHNLNIPLLSDSDDRAKYTAVNVDTPDEYFMSLKPTAEQLSLMRLKPGPNRITFTVNTSLQGPKSVACTIYLWPRDAKIVISDVDGTITKSDVWGQLMPIIGKDWSHEGVAELFTNIRNKQYHVVYLTARAVGQADATRDYLFGLSQENGQQMPDGPLIMSPDRLFSSFKREVIDREPFIFKIAALKDLRSLFPDNYNPYFAGFGNRDTDHRAYVNVGVPEARIFIVDTDSQVHHVNRTFAKTYGSMAAIVNDMFPIQQRSGDMPPIYRERSESTAIATTDVSRESEGLSSEGLRALRKYKRLQSLEYMARARMPQQLGGAVVASAKSSVIPRTVPAPGPSTSPAPQLQSKPTLPKQSTGVWKPRPRSSGATVSTRVKHALRT